MVSDIFIITGFSVGRKIQFELQAEGRGKPECAAHFSEEGSILGTVPVQSDEVRKQLTFDIRGFLQTHISKVE